MRLFAHNFLGPRIYATFENGIAYEYVAGKNLDYELAVDRNVYPLVATKGIILDKSLCLHSISCLFTYIFLYSFFTFTKVGKMHRLMSQYAGPKQPGHSSHQIFNTLRNWLMLVPMRLADPENHQRMIAELPSKATLVNELDELEVFYEIGIAYCKVKMQSFCIIRCINLHLIDWLKLDYGIVIFFSYLKWKRM